MVDIKRNVLAGDDLGFLLGFLWGLAPHGIRICSQFDIGEISHAWGILLSSHWSDCISIMMPDADAAVAAAMHIIIIIIGINVDVQTQVTLATGTTPICSHQ